LQIRASLHVLNKSTNQMQQFLKQFLKLITWCLLVCRAQNLSGVLTPIIRSSTSAVVVSGFNRWSVVVAVLLVVVKPFGPTATNSTATITLQRWKPEATTAVVERLMMGVRTPETFWALHTSKHQVINLRNVASGWLIYIKK
jgi:hypothetical protein